MTDYRRTRLPGATWFFTVVRSRKASAFPKAAPSAASVVYGSVASGNTPSETKTISTGTSIMFTGTRSNMDGCGV